MPSKATPGFQGSHRSGAEVVIYRQGSDAIIAAHGGGSGPYPLDGLNERSARPSVIAVSTQKAMGASGSFSVTLKAPADDPDLFAEVVDDDWVDIFLHEGKTRHHVMRGLVDEVRRSIAVGGSGATTRTWTISGRDFQKVYEQTPIYFDRYSTENVCGAAAYQLLEAQNVGGNVSDTVALFLKGFLSQQQGLGRANFVMPAGMPNAQPSFIDTVLFNDANYFDAPERISISPSLMQPEGMAWDLAKQWSDPMFCELYTELYPIGDSYDAAIAGTDPSTTQMSVVLRDKPFVVVDPAAGVPTGLDSQWFQLTTFEIPRQSIATLDVGRNGYERLNAYFCSPNLIQELTRSSMVDLTAPLWFPDDMRQHGMRRCDVVTQYLAANAADNAGMAAAQRLLVRDYNCMNPYWLSGTINFACGQPQLRIGCRLRIPGYDLTDDETYYIEAVGHSWSVQPGTRSTAMLTRGWRGTDSDLVSTLTQISGQYVMPQPASAGS